MEIGQCHQKVNLSLCESKCQSTKAFLYKLICILLFLLTLTAYYIKQACEFFSRLMLLCIALSFYSENTQDKNTLAYLQYIYLCSILTW